MKRLSLYVLVIAGLIGCITQPSDPPTIQLESPANGVQFVRGERVLVQSIARDERGVVKTELWVDGRLYEANRSEEATGNLEFDVIQIWDASALGEHTLTVRAHTADGRVSDPVSVTIQVVTAAPAPTRPPASTPTAAVDDSCVPSARFVEDVTVPDDSLFNAGVNFTKVWRLRNDGDCTWRPGTTWVFIGGNLLGAQSPIEAELAEPGRIIDIGVDMVAPASPGTYKSYWRLQDPGGEFFGDQAYVRIIVP